MNRFQDKKSATHWVVREGGAGGEFEYSTFAIGLKYLVETPRTAEKAVVNTLTAYAKIHTKVGEKEEWDQSKRIMVRRPVYDEGRELRRRKIDLKIERLTGIRDPGGVLEVEIVDPTAKTYPVKENSQGLNVRGLKFWLPTGKDKFGNDAQHTGTKVFYFLDDILLGNLLEKDTQGTYTFALRITAGNGVAAAQSFTLTVK